MLYNGDLQDNDTITKVAEHREQAQDISQPATLDHSMTFDSVQLYRACLYAE